MSYERFPAIFRWSVRACIGDVMVQGQVPRAGAKDEITFKGSGLLLAAPRIDNESKFTLESMSAFAGKVIPGT
jgi:hypothetical protein